MIRNLKILILEDKSSDAELSKLQLEDLEHFQCTYEVTDKKEEFIRLLETFQPDMIISDFNLPRFDGLKALAILREEDDLTPFIFVTGTLGEENAVEAIRSGATDFIVKQRIEQLPSAVIRALREKEQKESKKAITKQLLESQQNYKNLWHLSPLPMWVYELETYRFLNVNEAAISHYGYSREEFERLTIMDIRPEKDIPLVNHTVKTTQSANDSFQGVFRHRKKNGEIIDVEIKSTFIYHNGRKGRLVTSNDITQRKKSEMQLRRSNDQLRLAQQIAKLGYWTHHMETDQSEWSEEIYAIWERNSEYEVTYEKFLKTVHPEDRYLFMVPIENHPVNKYREFEHRILTSDGKLKWIQEKVMLIRDEEGNPSRFEGIAQDITEKKQLEKERVAILESITDGFFAVDDKWKVTYWNKAAEYILQIPKEKIVNKDLWEVLGPYIETKTYEEYYQAMDEQKARVFETHSPTLNLWIEVSIFPKGDGLSVYMKDISERRHHQHQIFKTIQETQEKERARFGRDMHDGLTQSLTAIKMNLAHFKEKLEQGKTQIDTFERAMEYLNNSIEESRSISHGLLSVTLVSYGLITALEEIANNISANNKVQVSFSHNLPDHRILSKELETNIYRIVQEALNNILKHSQASRAEIVLHTDTEGVQLTVRDNGIGIEGYGDNRNLSGAGLRNMQIRAEGFNGKLTLETSKSNGLQLNIFFPGVDL